MANRATAAKVERASKQARALAREEYSKPFYTNHLTIAQANHTREATASLVNAYLSNGGKVQVCKTVEPKPERVRGGFAADRSSIAPGKAARAGVRYRCIATGSVLIPAR